uniref:G patch domain-containing protein 1 n=1 Tax=Ceratitis capitata TaxID=7213 RepID=W8B376_CERCA
MYEEAGLHRFGTSLPELDEDTVPSKKPIRPEDQIVTDENGKRRFHGAFTGGFSAGYWNTVGSQEGWTPTTFKSSRSEKAAQRLQQRPSDFMDDEDHGEFGIAPQRLVTRAEYTSIEPEQSRKRKLMATNSGPIPGKPLLEQLIMPLQGKIGERILKSMGWRPGQGIGPRQTRKEKKMARARNQRETYVMQQYGYQPNPKTAVNSDEGGDETESSDEEPEKITFAPDDYDPYVCIAKKDRFGLGYRSNLSRDPILSNAHLATTNSGHINLFEPALEAMGKNNKKISFKGQAFGVGALEDEDEDIYAKDDMSRYDFSLENKKSTNKKSIIEQDQLIVGFSASNTPLKMKKPVNIKAPLDFVPRNWAERRSRFQPIDAKRAEELESYFKEVEQAKPRLNPDDRAALLAEGQRNNEKQIASTCFKPEQPQNQIQEKTILPKGAAKEVSTTRVKGGYDKLPERAKQMLKSLDEKDRFTHTTGFEKDNTSNSDSAYSEMMQQVQEKSKKFDSLSNVFKPFVHDEQKQRRYEDFLLADVKTEEEIARFLNQIQPIHLSEWDREMEMKEFMQASKIFKPLDGLMSQRFVSESNIADTCKPSEPCVDSFPAPKKITVERSKTMWKPHSLLCKRYNIAEPFGSLLEDEKPLPSSSKMSVFDYLEDCLNKKSDFKTPVIVPLKIPEVKPVSKQRKGSTDNDDVPGSKSATSVPVITPRNPSSSSSVTSIVVLDQLKGRHESSKDAKSDDQKVGRSKAKTDLEKLSESSIEKPAHEKLELYKAIFDDSSDEEGADQYEVTVISKEGDNSADCNIKRDSILNSDHVNLLRNTSPPRGIFSALLSKQVVAQNSQPTTCKSKESLEGEDKSSTSGSSEFGLTPTPAKEVSKETRIQFKQPLSTSSKTSINSATTSSSRSLSDELKVSDLSNEEKSPVKRLISERLQAGGSTDINSEVPSTSSGVKPDFYGPQLPQHIQTLSTSKAVDEMNKVIEEKMIRFLAQRAKNSRQVEDEGWVEKKIRRTLKSKKRSTSSSTDDGSSDEGKSQRKKGSKSNKKSKKKSREKKSKKSKKKKKDK